MGGNVVVPLQLPIGTADNFSGIVDLLRLKAYSFSDGGTKAAEIPDDLSDRVEEFRKSLIESIAEKDDALLESYFDTGELSASDMLRVLRESVARGELVPVLCGDAYLNRGVDLLMDAVYELLPSPVQFPPILLPEEIGLCLQAFNINTLLLKMMMSMLSPYQEK